jgi:hypothetical protein
MIPVMFIYGQHGNKGNHVYFRHASFGMLREEIVKAFSQLILPPPETLAVLYKRQQVKKGTSSSFVLSVLAKSCFAAFAARGRPL